MTNYELLEKQDIEDTLLAEDFILPKFTKKI